MEMNDENELNKIEVQTDLVDGSDCEIPETHELEASSEDTDQAELLVEETHELEVSSEDTDEAELQEENTSLEASSEDHDEQTESALSEQDEQLLWQARTGLSLETLPAAIETLVFMSDNPLRIQKIKSFIDDEIPLRVIHDAIAQLQEEYEKPHHGIRLLEVAEGYQFRTKATYSRFVQDLFKVTSLVLSPTALEVLAIIAYKQPVSKTEVEKIRGVDSSHIVRALMDKRLVRICGRSEEMGRPSQYATTTEFLEVFNLKDISELPPEFELEAMAETNNIGEISDIKNLVSNGDKAKFFFDEIGELDELASQIKNISVDTDFTKTLKNSAKVKREEGVPVKSAFDLLEEFIIKESIEKQNQVSLLSEALALGTKPRVVDPKEEGILNAPREEEEEEEVYLYPELIEEDEQRLAREKEELDLEEADLTDALDAAFDNLRKNAEDEDETLEKEDKDEVDLSEALDAAFENLRKNALSDDEAMESFGPITESEKRLENTLNDVSEQAEELDLDLSFLSNSSDTEIDPDELGDKH